MTITITLTPDQRAWLEGEVASGRFASIEEAVRVAVDALAVDDDLSWAKPLCDAAREQIARGEYLTLEEHRERMARRRKTLGY